VCLAQSAFVFCARVVAEAAPPPPGGHSLRGMGCARHRYIALSRVSSTTSRTYVRQSSDDPTDPWFLVRRPHRQQLGALAPGTASGDASLVSGKAIKNSSEVLPVAKPHQIMYMSRRAIGLSSDGTCSIGSGLRRLRALPSARRRPSRVDACKSARRFFKSTKRRAEAVLRHLHLLLPLRLQLRPSPHRHRKQQPRDHLPPKHPSMRILRQARAQEGANDPLAVARDTCPQHREEAQGYLSGWQHRQHERRRENGRKRQP
jgi:hypothetical protein